MGKLPSKFVIKADREGMEVSCVLEESTICPHSHAVALRHHKNLKVLVVLDDFNERVFLEFQHFDTQALQSLAELANSSHQISVILHVRLSLDDGDLS